MKPLSLNKGPNHQANALVTNNKWLIIIIFFPNIPSFFLSFSDLSTFTFWAYRVILAIDHNDTHTHTQLVGLLWMKNWSFAHFSCFIIETHFTGIVLR